MKRGRPCIMPQYNFAGIYQITNKVTQDFYIGQATNILKRLNEHKKKRNKDIYVNSIFYKAIEKYGWENFEFAVLEKIDNIEILNDREKFWISTLKPKYNIHEGGNCARGWHHTEETKKKISIARTKKYSGANNPFFGKQHTEETKEKIRQANTGKKRSKEHMQAIIKANTGLKKSQETIEKIRKANSGKKRTPETIEKIRQAMYKRYRDIEQNPHQ